jgi:hypothetical protein
MRYVPNLIPDKAKVLPGYFAGNEYGEQFSGIKKILSLSTAFIILIIALTKIIHPPLFLLLLLMGAGLVLPVHRWLEGRLKLRLTTVIKTVLYGILMIPCSLLIAHYNSVDKEIARQQHIQTEKIQREKQILAVKDSIRRDSLQQDLKVLNDMPLLAKMNQRELDNRFAHALTLAVNPDEITAVEHSRLELKKMNVSSFLKKGRYREALSDLNTLLASSPGNTKLLYDRALCYDKLGDPQSAVNDLRSAMQSGDDAAEKYYNKLNPERKKVSYYITRCCDGSTSGAKGRGACSWHGGVCNWNDPVYETYRKYQ